MKDNSAITELFSDDAQCLKCFREEKHRTLFATARGKVQEKCEQLLKHHILSREKSNSGEIEMVWISEQEKTASSLETTLTKCYSRFKTELEKHWETTNGYPATTGNDCNMRYSILSRNCTIVLEEVESLTQHAPHLVPPVVEDLLLDQATSTPVIPEDPCDISGSTIPPYQVSASEQRKKKQRGEIPQLKNRNRSSSSTSRRSEEQVTSSNGDNLFGDTSTEQPTHDHAPCQPTSVNRTSPAPNITDANIPNMEKMLQIVEANDKTRKLNVEQMEQIEEIVEKKMFGFEQRIEKVEANFEKIIEKVVMKYLPAQPDPGHNEAVESDMGTALLKPTVTDTLPNSETPPETSENATPAPDCEKDQITDEAASKDLSDGSTLCLDRVASVPSEEPKPDTLQTITSTSSQNIRNLLEEMDKLETEKITETDEKAPGSEHSNAEEKEPKRITPLQEDAFIPAPKTADPPISSAKQAASEKGRVLRSTRKRRNVEYCKPPIVTVNLDENLPPVKDDRGKGRKRPKRAKKSDDNPKKVRRLPLAPVLPTEAENPAVPTAPRPLPHKNTCPVISVTNMHKVWRADKNRACATQTTPSVVGRKIESKTEQGEKEQEQGPADTELKEAASTANSSISQTEFSSGEFVDKVPPLTSSLLPEMIERTSEYKPRTRGRAVKRSSSRKRNKKAEVTLVTVSEDDDSLPDPELSLDLENLKDNDSICDSSISLIPL